jgi:rhamnogalacturonyl hydrolase YesR
MYAPDLAIEVRTGASAAWFLPDQSPAGLLALAKQLGQPQTLPPSDELPSALVRSAPSNTGIVPALRVTVSAPDGGFLRELLRASGAAEFRGPSPARQEIQKRLARTPLEVARQLAEHYGHEMETVEYIRAVALIGRLRLGELTGDRAPLDDVERIVAPFARGEKPALGPRASGSAFAGHLIFGELAKVTKNPAYIMLLRRVGEFGFDPQGRPLEVMPSHNEMSDAVFMSTPVLVQAGRIAGDAKYFDMALRHMRFMLKLNLRPDGLHQHSPLDPAAWGRGNGFPALGLTLSLTDLPGTHPDRPEILAALRAHLEALLPHQDHDGAWHQVIDFPGSYRELTATSMITFAMARGVRLGWLEGARYHPAIERAWNALRTRIAPDGGLVDVCTGTGKQQNLRAYLDRPAILGPDPRGGAMALLAATEMALLQQAN